MSRIALPSWRLTATLAVLAALWLAMLLSEGGPLDQRIYRALYAGGHPLLVSTARFFTFFGEPTVLVVAGFLVAGWLWLRSRGRLALSLLLLILLGRGLSEIQKYTFARPRPAIEPHLVMVKTWSFPSGHAASSMIFYLTMALA